MITDQNLAEYCIARYRLGFDYVAIYMAVVLFEKTIDEKIREQLRRTAVNQDPNRMRLEEKINALDTESIEAFNTYNYFDLFGIADNEAFINFLHRIRNRLRNNVAHAVEDLNELLNNRQAFIVRTLLFVCCENSLEFFSKRFSQMDKINHAGFMRSLDPALCDYTLREIDERMIFRYDRLDTPDPDKEYFEELELSDFDNLYQLRHKMNQLRHDLNGRFAEREDSKGQFHKETTLYLQTTILTPIDTTSAYVWLPLVFASEDEELGRVNLTEMSVSLLATPLDFRIYLDFGGLTKGLRKKHLTFLKEEKDLFLDFLGSLSEQDRGLFKFFDTEWYAFITRQNNAFELCQNEKDFYVEIERAEKDIKAIEDQEIKTKNRMLYGFIYGRDFFEKSVLTKEEVFDKLDHITMLYHQFLLYLRG